MSSEARQSCLKRFTFRVILKVLCAHVFCTVVWPPVQPACAKPAASSELPSAALPSSIEAPAVVAGEEGWLFLQSELRFLKFPTFWGEAARHSARSLKPENADPAEAILDFHRQLKERGIRLILMPVPPKASLTREAPAPVKDLEGFKTDSLTQFYKFLKSDGVEVVDLRPTFQMKAQAGELMYCKTDSHWSGSGCVTAAQILSSELREIFRSGPSEFKAEWQKTPICGDLTDLSGRKDLPNEKVDVRQISSEKNVPLAPDSNSPLLLIGDSHTLVFHDFLAEKAGLPEQLAKETGVVPDWIGTRGSGANAVRLSLLRRNIKDPTYLASKKVIVWCFAAREFTETEEGWQKIPLTRASAAR